MEATTMTQAGTPAKSKRPKQELPLPNPFRARDRAQAELQPRLALKEKIDTELRAMAKTLDELSARADQLKAAKAPESDRRELGRRIGDVLLHQEKLEAESARLLKELKRLWVALEKSKAMIRERRQKKAKAEAPDAKSEVETEAKAASPVMETPVEGYSSHRDDEARARLEAAMAKGRKKVKAKLEADDSPKEKKKSVAELESEIRAAMASGQLPRAEGKERIRALRRKAKASRKAAKAKAEAGKSKKK